MDKMKIIAKKYGVDFGRYNNMYLSDYLRKVGYPSLANALETCDKKISKKHKRIR